MFASAKSGLEDCLSEYVCRVTASSHAKLKEISRERPDPEKHAAEVASCRAFMALSPEGQAAHFAAQQAAYEAARAEVEAQEQSAAA